MGGAACTNPTKTVLTHSLMCKIYYTLHLYKKNVNTKFLHMNIFKHENFLSLLFCIHASYTLPTTNNDPFYPLTVTSERVNEILQTSLKAGYFNLTDLKGILSGKHRSGKSHTLARLFKMKPPQVPVSTGVAEGAVQGCSSAVMADIRDVSHEVLRASEDEWYLMSPEETLKLLAMAVSEGVLTGDLVAIVDEFIKRHQQIQPDSVTTSATDSPPTEESLPHLPSLLPQISISATKMATLIQNCRGSQKILELKLLHFVDSGGQPQFHEVLPAFIHNTTVIILVLKLNESLDASSRAELCDEEGVTYTNIDSALFNNEEILEHQIRTIQAKPSGLDGDRKAKVVVVGTHRDEEERLIKEKVCPETRSQKNKKLRSLFLPFLASLLIMFRADEIIFPVNVLNPNEDDWEVLRVLRKKIMEAGLFSKYKIPVGWFLLEQDIRTFAENKGQKVVSVSDCVTIAASLQINRDILEAALLYFHILSIFLYCPNILPDIVFVSPQVPVDCLFQLVAFQYKVSHGMEKGVMAEDVEYLKKGIVTVEMMKSDVFSRCFYPLYTPSEAIKLYQSLFIAAPLPDHKYLMPFMLPVASKTEIAIHIPLSPSVPPLLIMFMNKSTSEVTCVPNGVFCGLVACLLSKTKWGVSRNKDNDIKCMARNIVILSNSNPPSSLTIVNTQTYFELYVDFGIPIFSTSCPRLKRIVFKAIEDVLNAFKFHDIILNPAFQCYCSSPPHPTVLNECKGVKYLYCKKESLTKLTEKHLIWKVDITSASGNIFYMFRDILLCK